MKGHLSNQEWADQFRQRQAALRATRLEALEQIMVETLREEVEAQQQAPLPSSRPQHWVNTVGQWFVNHSWLAQQFQEYKVNRAATAETTLEVVIEGDYEVIEIRKER